MTVHGDNYVLDSGKSGHARLRVISEIHDERTRALLLEAGLEAGDRYVEFGCGLGYVTRWATSIGADALGIDLSADQSRGGDRTGRGQDRVPCRKRVRPRPASGELRRRVLALAAHSPEPAGRRDAQHLRSAQARRPDGVRGSRHERDLRGAAVRLPRVRRARLRHRCHARRGLRGRSPPAPVGQRGRIRRSPRRHVSPALPHGRAQGVLELDVSRGRSQPRQAGRDDGRPVSTRSPRPCARPTTIR